MAQDEQRLALLHLREEPGGMATEFGERYAFHKTLRFLYINVQNNEQYVNNNFMAGIMQLKYNF